MYRKFTRELPEHLWEGDGKDWAEEEVELGYTTILASADPGELWNLEVPLEVSQTETKGLSFCAFMLTTHRLQVASGEQACP